MVTTANMMIIEAEIEGNGVDTKRATVTSNDITTKTKKTCSKLCHTT